MAAERAWKLTRSAFEFFTPEGRFNDRQQAQAVVAAALTTRAVQLGQDPAVVAPPRELHVPDQAQRRLAELGLDADVLFGLAGPGRLAPPSLATVGVNARVSRDTGFSVGPHGPTSEGRTPLAGISWAGS